MTNQANPENFTIDQIKNIVKIYKTWASYTIDGEFDKYADILTHPEKNQALYNQIINEWEEKFDKGLIDAGLYDVYYYLNEYNWQEWEKEQMKKEV